MYVGMMCKVGEYIRDYFCGLLMLMMVVDVVGYLGDFYLFIWSFRKVNGLMLY